MNRQMALLVMIVLLVAMATGCSLLDGEKKPTQVNAESKAVYVADSAKPAIDLGGIETPSNEKLAFSLLAVGTQTYSCKPKDGHFEWSGTPEADLYNDKGEKVGRHKGGPIWETLDGSSNVVADAAQRKAKAAPGNSADTIDWLWLPKKSRSAGGMFGLVTSIQRVNTVGGSKKFAGPCDQGKDAKPVPVYYSATYYFNTDK